MRGMKPTLAKLREDPMAAVEEAYSPSSIQEAPRSKGRGSWFTELPDRLG